MDLFEQNTRNDRHAPLAERMRPSRLDEVVGQRHLLAEGMPLRRLIETDQVTSLILWGPPGTGKTTLAQVVAASTESEFEFFSAVLQGVKEVREVVKKAQEQRRYHGRKTILFVDEIHRFNKAQQDAFLPYVERGEITLIGATTENPSFEINSALLSRSRVFVLKPLTSDDLALLVHRAIEDVQGLGRRGLQIDEEAVAFLTAYADGDARAALNSLEVAANTIESKTITLEALRNALQKKPLLYDKGAEEHYNIISAFIKSMRGSDPDAALYWLARMIEAGEDPLFITRRLVIFASEDVGNADPRALQIAVAAQQAVHFVGLPEGRINLAQAVTYLATAPKSNASYAGINKAQAEVRKSGALEVPMHIRNAPTSMMKEMGYGKDYRYAHDYREGYARQDHLPEQLQGVNFYRPTDHGYERHIRERLDHWKRLERERAAGEEEPGPGDKG